LTGLGRFPSGERRVDLAAFGRRDGGSHADAPCGWPAVIGGLAGAQTLVGVLHRRSVLHALFAALLLIAAPAIALGIVVRFTHVPLRGLYLLRALLFAALVSSVLACGIDITSASSHVLDFPMNAPLRGVAHFVGMFVITPVAFQRTMPSGITSSSSSACAPNVRREALRRIRRTYRRVRPCVARAR
jgi:hypothetical protein